jgi:hypothetical protein
MHAFSMASARMLGQTQRAGVVQIFSLATGELLEESEYEYENACDPLSATSTPSADAIWVQNADEPHKLQRFRAHPPGAISKWRLARLKDSGEVNGFPSARKLTEQYALPEDTTKPNTKDKKEESDEKAELPPPTPTVSSIAAAAASSSLLTGTQASQLVAVANSLGAAAASASGSASASPSKEDDAVDVTVAICTILSRLNADCDLLSQPDAQDVPNSLCLPLAVELSKPTFNNLLELVELLSADFYAPQSTLEQKFGAHTQLRLFAFLVVLRLLQKNISFMVCAAFIFVLCLLCCACAAPSQCLILRCDLL